MIKETINMTCADGRTCNMSIIASLLLLLLTSFPCDAA